MAKLQRPKGTQDITPDISDAWHWMEDAASIVLRQSGYKELRTPILETTELFARGVGESTDIVNKEMYTFERSDRSFTLRPEGTAGIVRAYIENGLHKTPKPQKLFYSGPMFRYERPQKGRQRQFHQLGCELFGLDTPASDAEAILLALDVLKALGIEGTMLHINNVGDADDRARFQAGIKQTVQPFFDELCEDCHRRYEQNPLRMLDCKVKGCRAHYDGEVVQQFIQTFEWGEASTASFNELLSILDSLGISYVKNPLLVRGLDYYTRTVFEITTDQLGAQSAICGGGRYNQLVQDLGGPDTPAIGWAMGVERLFELCQSQVQPNTKPSVYLLNQDPVVARTVSQALSRTELFASVETDLTGRKEDKQFKAALQKNVELTVTVQGEQVRIKHLASKKEWQGALEQLQTDHFVVELAALLHD